MLAIGLGGTRQNERKRKGILRNAQLSGGTNSMTKAGTASTTANIAMVTLMGMCGVRIMADTRCEPRDEFRSQVL